jgi:hypothetical protein
MTWDEVHRTFISRFNENCSERQATTTMRYAKQKKYKFVEDYYDRLLRLCVVIP